MSRKHKPTSSSVRAEAVQFLGAVPALLLCLATLLTPLVVSNLTILSDYLKLVVYEVAIVAALGCGLALWLVRGTLGVPALAAFVGMAVFYLVNVISFVGSEYRWMGEQELWRLGALLAGAVVMTVFFDTTPRRLRACRAFLWASIPICVYAFLQRLGKDPISWSNTSTERVFATLGNPDMLAGYCVVAAPVCFFFGLAVKRWPERIVAWATTAALLVTLELTLTRGGAMGLAAAIAVALWRYRRSLLATRRRALITVGVLAVGLAVVTIGAWPLLKRFAEVPVTSKKEPNAAPEKGPNAAPKKEPNAAPEKGPNSADVRIAIWKGAWRIFRAYPTLGCGPGQFTIYFPQYRDREYEAEGLTQNILHAHSEYLETLAETGVVGLVAFLAMLGVIAWVGWRNWGALSGPEQWLQTGWLSGAAGLLTHNLVSVNLRWPGCPFYFWVVVGLLLSTGRRRECPLPAWLARPVAGRAALAVALVVLGLLAWQWTIRPCQAELAYMRADVLKNRAEFALKLGRLRESNDELAAATWEFQRAIEYKPTHLLAYYHLAATYFKMNDYAHAAETYGALLPYAPNYALVHYNLMVCYTRMGRWDDAAKEAELQKRIRAVVPGGDFDRLIEFVAARLAELESQTGGTGAPGPGTTAGRDGYRTAE